MVQMRRLGLETRQAIAESKKSGETPNFSDVCRKYEMFILDPKTQPKVASFYAIKYARFQAKVNFSLNFDGFL